MTLGETLKALKELKLQQESEGGHTPDDQPAEVAAQPQPAQKQEQQQADTINVSAPPVQVSKLFKKIKVGFSKLHKDREVTLVCNTKYDGNRRPSKKRVQFVTDMDEVREREAMGQVRDIVGLFPGEREALKKEREAHADEKVEDILYIRASELKYDREELFFDTPVFKYPMIGFNEEAQRQHLWKMLQRSLMTPFPEERRRFVRLIEVCQDNINNESEKQKEEDFPAYVRNKCHKFPFYYIKMTQGQYDILVEEGMIDGVKPTNQTQQYATAPLKKGGNNQLRQLYREHSKDPSASKNLPLNKAPPLTKQSPQNRSVSSTVVNSGGKPAEFRTQKTHNPSLERDTIDHRLHHTNSVKVETPKQALGNEKHSFSTTGGKLGKSGMDVIAEQDMMYQSQGSFSSHKKWVSQESIPGLNSQRVKPSESISQKRSITNHHRRLSSVVEYQNAAAHNQSSDGVLHSFRRLSETSYSQDRNNVQESLQPSKPLKTLKAILSEYNDACLKKDMTQSTARSFEVVKRPESERARSQLKGAGQQFENLQAGKTYSYGFGVGGSTKAYKVPESSRFASNSTKSMTGAGHLTFGQNSINNTFYPQGDETHYNSRELSRSGNRLHTTGQPYRPKPHDFQRKLLDQSAPLIALAKERLHKRITSISNQSSSSKIEHRDTFSAVPMLPQVLELRPSPFKAHTPGKPMPFTSLMKDLFRGEHNYVNADLKQVIKITSPYLVKSAKVSRKIINDENHSYAYRDKLSPSSRLSKGKMTPQLSLATPDLTA